MADNRYLLRHRQGWYAVVEVPVDLRAKLGRRLKRSLKTADVYTARARRYRAVAELQRQIEEARHQKPGDNPLVVEAMAWREAVLDAEERDDPHGNFSGTVSMALTDRAEALEREEEGRGVEFAAIATGASLPLELHVDTWLSQGSLSGRALAFRTTQERRSAVSGLASWLTAQRLPVTVEAISKRLAGRYVSEELIASGRAPATVAKLIQSLQAYWAWLQKRGHIADEVVNPWAGQSPRRAAANVSEAERAFTQDEVALLLAAPPSPVMRDLILFAALTGMRREELGLLRVKDCEGVVSAAGQGAAGVFSVRHGKTAAATRRVPIHSLLAPLVAHRMAGKGPEGFLFADLPGDGKRRTDAIGHAFTRYRRTLKLEDGDGRRSLINFHSLRRFFITEAVNAGQPPHLVSQVVGHAEGRKGMTLGRYWAGGEDEALRAVVEAVKLSSSVVTASVLPDGSQSP